MTVKSYSGSNAPLGNLPAEPNTFIGRERDLADLVAMLEHVRALTLCGPGGIGKTRLALKLATSSAADFPDGAWMADLANADAAERLVPVVTAALGIRHEADRPLIDTLAEALRPRAMLLVLDTCEHLIQACAELVQQLLGLCPDLRIIATSREALRVRGEVIWRVPPLGLPPADAGGQSSSMVDDVLGCEAGRLFVARATAVRPAFSLHLANAAAVARICRTLDGVPLAIELAAARARTLSAEQIRLRLASKFELLAQGDRTAPPRQQALRATVEWSFDLLTVAERTLLRRLSVFTSWNLDMAEQVCADEQIPADDILDLLTALIDKSLVIVDAELDGDGRYRLLDAVRELATELAAAAGELPGLRAAHRDCMVALAERLVGQAFVRGDPPWEARVAIYHRVLTERANFNLALGYAVQQSDADGGLRICQALSGSWLASGDVAEGSDWIDQLLVIDAVVQPDLRARALAVRAELAYEQQDFKGVAEHAAACLELSEASGGGNPATALRLQALLLLMVGDYAGALSHADAALAAARRMNDDWEAGVARAARAVVLAGQGRQDDAEAEYTRALDLLSDNNQWGVANVLYGLGQLARARDRSADAVRYFSDALAIYQQIDARPEMARCLGGIGLVALAQPDLAVARPALAQSVRLNISTGQRLGIARGLAALASLAALRAQAGDQERAVQVAGAAQALFEAVGVPSSTGAAGRLGRLIDQARDVLGRSAVAALEAEGRALSPHAAIAIADAEPPGPVPAEVPGSQPGPDDFTGNDHGQLPGWPAGLTEREQEVALLIARSLSNKLIGDQLVITSATAARHIANIFGKLGVTSRAQVTAWVIRAAPGRH